MIGVIGVVVLYLAVNFVCLRVLGPDGLAATRTPASAVMRAALGERGARWIAVGIAISTLGFLSQGILTAPRVYYAMARDGLFFRSVGWLSPRTGAPVVAIVLQGVTATVIALSGRYEQISELRGLGRFHFLRPDRGIPVCLPAEDGGLAATPYLTPGHPYTTGALRAGLRRYRDHHHRDFPANTAIGLIILLAGIPVYLYWSRAKRRNALQPNQNSNL